MINKNQECDIVSDLLPLYMERQTGEESNEFIREHLKHCEECRKNLQFMEASFEELMQDENVVGKNESEKTRSIKGKHIKVFKKAKGRIFVCGYLLLLLCFWLYMIFVLFP